MAAHGREFCIQDTYCWRHGQLRLVHNEASTISMSGKVGGVGGANCVNCNGRGSTECCIMFVGLWLSTDQ